MGIDRQPDYRTIQRHIQRARQSVLDAGAAKEAAGMTLTDPTPNADLKSWRVTTTITRHRDQIMYPGETWDSMATAEVTLPAGSNANDAIRQTGTDLDLETLDYSDVERVVVSVRPLP